MLLALLWLQSASNKANASLWKLFLRLSVLQALHRQQTGSTTQELPLSCLKLRAEWILLMTQFAEQTAEKQR